MKISVIVGDTDKWRGITSYHQLWDGSKFFCVLLTSCTWVARNWDVGSFWKSQVVQKCSKCSKVVWHSPLWVVRKVFFVCLLRRQLFGNLNCNIKIAIKNKSYQYKALDLTQIAQILKHTYKLKVFCLINFYVVQILVLHFDKFITDFIHRLCLTTVKSKWPNLVTTV